jgi:hypothetical protein
MMSFLFIFLFLVWMISFFMAMGLGACTPKDVLLILKMREIIFFAGKLLMGHLKGYLERAKTFFTSELSRAQLGTIQGSKKSIPASIRSQHPSAQWNLRGGR